jgi:hypothetical protein
MMITPSVHTTSNAKLATYKEAAIKAKIKLLRIMYKRILYSNLDLLSKGQERLKI